MDHPVRHQLTLLLTSPRVAPGLLSASAWESLRAATAVLAADPGAATPQALAAAGIEVGAPDQPALSSPPALARYLLGQAREGSLVWVGSVDGDPGLAEALAVELPEDDAPALELLVASWDTPGARLLDAVAVMDRLRSPGGCPWDAQQTHGSLTPYLLEEAHEAAEVLERLDDDGQEEPELRRDAVDELGDVLLQVLFHARVAEDHPEDPFGVDDVAGALVAKLVRRHPHVFADVDAPDAAAVEANWDAIKAGENAGRQDRDGPLAGIPRGMPALARAARAAARLQRLGRGEELADWVAGQELAGDPGAVLLRTVLDLRAAGADPDAALRRTLRTLEAEVGRPG